MRWNNKLIYIAIYRSISGSFLSILIHIMKYLHLLLHCSGSESASVCWIKLSALLKQNNLTWFNNIATPTQTLHLQERNIQRKRRQETENTFQINHNSDALTYVNSCKFSIFSRTDKIFLASPIHPTCVYNIPSAALVLLQHSSVWKEDSRVATEET